MIHDLELRVLTGLHQGAGCAVQDGALLGSDPRCNVVLCDDGIAEEAGRLSLGDGTWRIATQERPDDASDLPFGTAFRLGPIFLTIAHANDPWPDLTELSAMLGAPSTSTHDMGSNVARDREAIDPEPASGTTRERPYQPPHNPPGSFAAQYSASFRAPAPPRRKGAGMRWAVGGLLVFLIFGGVASFSPAKVQSSPRTELEPIAEATALPSVRRLLKEQGYAGRIQADPGPDQTVVVTGWILDQAEQDRLATALSAIWPLPSLRVENQALIVNRINAGTHDLDIYASPEFRGPGQLAIRGIAPSDAARSEAYRRWRNDADLPAQATMTLLLVEDVIDALDKAVAAAGLPRVPSAWKDQSLQIDPQGLRPPQQSQLTSLLDTLNASYMNALRLRGTMQPTPFHILSVVGGRQPWVVLEDGTRIVVGGTHGAYRLTSIEDGRVTFDGPGTTVIPR